ncbi:DUF4251 domain-containing protein [Flavobacterium granuli]|uniref:Uncharacterized protein DUF4251 n=1 Tax=Flavobacterium granuli TaxID=280093 RepID=A0A1M5LX95_9FLAO|nr:DUF4251 domain-containing protein [Flavobacterium granuli]PRZ24137.1 uncharacterized protein DUF4251 [Flavobacterium granuli]SHG69667.1 protein of unknown function [Flavobacterium granuli]
MKSKKIILVVFLLLTVAFGFAQEKTRKQLRKEQQIEKARQIAILIDSKEFVFVANKAFPLGFRDIDLTTNPNFIAFKPDFIRSEMPFFGRGYSGIGYGGDTGLKFEGKPSEFTIEKGKNTYEIKATVRGKQDVFNILLSVFFEGNARLTISSNNRSSISYNGEISKIEKKEDK